MNNFKALVSNIDIDYIKELQSYSSPITKVKAKNVCAILMARGLLRKGKIWWYAWENIGRRDEFFGSHKMPARMSDLSVKYPEYFESREVGKYKVYRIRFEKLTQNQLADMTNTTFKIEDLYK